VVDTKGKSKIDMPPTLNVISHNLEKQECKTWEQPPDGWIKCNKKGSWGAIIQNCRSAEMGEAIACLEGLKLGAANSALNLVIETDCAGVIEAFDDDNRIMSELCFIAKDFKRMKPTD
jgi:hypothetical protein